MLAEVALEADGAHAHVGRVKALEGGERAVGRPVVHEDQLEGARPGIERCDRTPVELVDRPRLIEDRHHDRQIGGREICIGDEAGLERLCASHGQQRIVPWRSLFRGTRAAEPLTKLRLMPAAWLERRLLIVTAVALYGAVFIAFVAFEVPGLGLGHFFYIPVALLALAGGTRFGLLGGGVAAALYALAIAVTPRLPTQDVLTLAMAIRLVTYSSCGLLIGWFANEHRRHLEQLREFADRDFLTGLLNTRVFDEVLARRCNAEAPFLLVLGDMDDLKLLNDTHGHTAGNQKLRDLANALRRLTDPRTNWRASAVTSSRSSSKDDWQAPRSSARSSVPTSKRRICR